MKAIVVEQPGGADELQYRDSPEPTPGPGEVLVRTAAAGVNFIETYQRDGTYPMTFPYVPGAEGAGTIAALGDGVTDLRVGQRIATAEGSGTYADLFLVDAEKAVPVPDDLDDRSAAALPLQGFTAHYLATSTFRVEPQHTVLLHAGAGGVGLLLTQLLRRIGATVITTVSTDDKEALSRAAGADHVLRYDGLADEVRALTGGRGVDVVYDGVGRDTFDASLASLAPRGMLVLFGGASGAVPPVDPMRLNRGGSLFLTRPTMKDYLQTVEERRWRARELFEAISAGELDVRVGAAYALADAGQAHLDLQARATTGKSILLP
ncbi:quinone oxidoreductase family protein [Cryobacterium sp. AP23]